MQVYKAAVVLYPCQDYLFRCLPPTHAAGVILPRKCTKLLLFRFLCSIPSAITIIQQESFSLTRVQQ